MRFMGRPVTFDAAKFPLLTFKSKQVAAGKIVGEMTMHGVSREVVLDVDGPTGEIKDPYGRIKMGASATAKIKRSDFGLSWNAALEAGGVLVGDDIAIVLEVQFVKAA
jgi:polyisoprenoid-binding protein YceI